MHGHNEAINLSLAEATWVLTLGEAAGSSNEEITVRVTQSSKAQSNATLSQHRTGLIRSAAACGSRTFVASANACIDYSEMPLDVVLVSGPDSYKAASLSGNFRIASLIFTEGTFSLSFGSVNVYAEITRDGTVQSVHGNRSEGGIVPVLSLLRTATN
jgi:hypothetical protein